MIITLPRRAEYITNEIALPKDKPLFRLSPVKRGIMFFNDSGKPVAQVAKYEDSVRATLADGGCAVLKKDGKGVKIVSFDVKKDKKESLDEAKKRTFDNNLIFFGNAEQAQYEIFVKDEGEIKPKSYVKAVAHPLFEKLVNVYIDENRNVLFALALCFAVGFFE